MDINKHRAKAIALAVGDKSVIDTESPGRQTAASQEGHIEPSFPQRIMEVILKN